MTASLIITPVVAFPAKVQEGDTVNNIVYHIKNNTDSESTLSFNGLQGGGVTYSCNATTLAAGATAQLNVTFVAPSLPDGATEKPYSHFFKIGSGGSKSDTPFMFTSTITEGSATITISSDITFDTAATFGDTFDIQLDGADNYTFPDINFGLSTLGTINPGQYTCTVTPSSVTGSDSANYLAPAPFDIYLNSHNLIIPIEYKEDVTYAVSTNMTAPNLGTATVAVEMVGSVNTYTHDQDAGTHAFDNVSPDTYTISAANYTGTDAKEYRPILNNPYKVSAPETINIPYEAVPTPGSNFDWQTERMSTVIKEANVALAIIGGGSTTAPVQISTNPPINPFLNSAIASYVASPVDIQATAEIQNFPSYIGIGTVTEVGSTVTTQLEGQLLDATNRYEGNGDGNAGCFFDNDEGVHVAMTPGAGSVGTISAGNKVIIADPYSYIADGKVYYYDGTITSIVSTGSNEYAINVTYNQVPQHPNPDLSLVKKFNFPATSTMTYNATMPNYELTPPGTETKINFSSENLCNSFWYSWGGYTPQAPAIAAQAQTVRSVNSHNLMAGVVLYTTRNSDSTDNIIDDLTNDFSLTAYLYNAMVEACLLQKEKTDNNVDTILLLNPDSTQVYQACTQYYCPIVWKSGITQDPKATIIQMPNLLADVNSAIDRLIEKEFITSGTGVTLKALIVSSNILTPPAGSGRAVAGMPEYYLLQNLLVKQLAPEVPFGWGQNIYDNTNPLMNVGTPPVAGAPWRTGSFDWLHKINSLGYSQELIDQCIQFEANCFAQFLKDMNYANYSGNIHSAYMPDFIYFDRYERDVIPAYVSGGYLMNGNDWNNYFNYIKKVSIAMNNTPIVIWQMPGASLQVQGDTFTGVLADTFADYAFGHADLNNDFSNIATALDLDGQAFTQSDQQYVYFNNSANVEDYLKLTDES